MQRSLEQVGRTWVQVVPLWRQTGLMVLLRTVHWLLLQPGMCWTQLLPLWEQVYLTLLLVLSQLPVAGLQAWLVWVQLPSRLMPQVGPAHLTVAHLLVAGTQHTWERMVPQDTDVSSL